MKSEKRRILLEIKSISEEGFFAGYASIYEVEDSHNDVILSGAFCDSLRKKKYGKDIKLLWQHQVDEPIGVFKKVIEDDLGLYVEGQLKLGVRRADEAFELMAEGALDGLSIGFTVEESEYDEESGVRLIYKADLWEISLVTFPANEAARVTKLGTAGSKTKREKDILGQEYQALGKTLDELLTQLECIS